MTSVATSRKHFRVRRMAVLLFSPLVATLLLVYFLPREGKFGYEYEQNRPWRYSQLIAPWDFSVFKTAEELQRERKERMEDYHPYYKLDTSVCVQQLMRLRQDFRTFTDVPSSFEPRLETLLRGVYARGIMSSEDLVSLEKDNHAQFYLLVDDVAGERSTENVLTPATAYNEMLRQEGPVTGRSLLECCHVRNYLTTNISYEASFSEARKSELMAVSDTCGRVQSGELIIDRGQIVTPRHVKILDSMKRESERRRDPQQGYWMIFMGQFLFVISIMVLFFFYLKLFRREYLASPHTLLLLYTIITIFPLLTYIMVQRQFSNVFVLPFAMVPIFIRLFVDSRTAFVGMVISAVLSSLVLFGPFEFLLVQLAVGMTAIYSLRELTERSQLLKTAAMVTFMGLFVTVTYDLAQGIDLFSIDRSRCFYICFSGILLLFAYPLMYLIERTFGFTSDVTLVELTNINNSILRKMSKVAQGTFNHSMQVGNLASEVADKIGAKPQLVRTGALYHDIGKMQNPAFFTENQSGVNPHNQLSEERSAQIIVGHVTDGLKLAEKYHLPTVIRDFIRTHHGAGMAKYFYIQCVNKHPGETVDKSLFSYPGPNPFTREQAILMMCDSVEAASRSLKEYTEESISALVNKIIDGQLADGCFRECPITFRDIADTKRVLVDSLKTIYHTRISYPEMNRQQDAVSDTQRTGFFGTGLHRTWKR